VGSEVAFVAGGTTLISSSEELEGFKTAISGRTLVAFDAEGVDLSREGRLTLISVGVEVEGGVHVFLLDPIHPEIGLRNDILLNAKNLLEDPGVTKIVHDCRQDSDALYRTLDPPIELKNVFDTQVSILPRHLYFSSLPATTHHATSTLPIRSGRCGCPVHPNGTT
jgi:ribonuclease D